MSRLLDTYGSLDIACKLEGGHGSGGNSVVDIPPHGTGKARRCRALPRIPKYRVPSIH